MVIVVMMTMVEEESRRRPAKGQHVLYGDASRNGRAPLVHGKFLLPHPQLNSLIKRGLSLLVSSYSRVV